MRRIKEWVDACSNCVHFTQYYKMSYRNFDVAEYGFCGLKKQNIKGAEICDCFCKRRNKRLRVEEIDEAISVIAGLKKFSK